MTRRFCHFLADFPLFPFKLSGGIFLSCAFRLLLLVHILTDNFFYRRLIIN